MMFDYIKAKRRVVNIISASTRIRMTDVDQLIDGLLLEVAPAQQNDKHPAEEAKLPTSEWSSISWRERLLTQSFDERISILTMN